MNKIESVKSICLLTCLIISVTHVQSQKAPDAPGVWRKTTNSITYIPSGDRTMANRMLEAIVDAVKDVYPQPIGADVEPYGGVFKNYRGVSEFPDGPYVFKMTIPFYELYYTKTNGTEASGEYASSLAIWVNSAKYLLQGNYIQNGNDLVFRNPWPGIAVNGFPKYNNMLLVLPAGKKLPWRPATKQEYLENFIADLKASFAGKSTSPMEIDQVAVAQRLLASMSANERNEIAYLKKIKYSGEKGYSDFNNYKWAGFQQASDTTADQLVIVDEKFYDKSLPRNSFQLLVIERRYARATLSAAAPTPEGIKRAKRIGDRLNAIVRHKDFLPKLQQLMGKDGLEYVARNKKEEPPKKTVVKRVSVKNIDRIVDSMMRYYKPNFPSVITSAPPARDPPVKEPNFPAVNSKKIALATRQLNTTAEVIQYLDDLEKKVTGALAISVQGYNDAKTNSQASIGYWLVNKPRESLLLAIKAAKQQPENNTALNNLGSTLSLCGIDYMAVPLYIVCIKKEPNNSTLMNNLGQSWLQLGEIPKAELYLKKAIATAPYHHNANNSLGLIYQKQGKKEQAIKCFENSIRGNFTLEGYNRLKALKKEAGLKLMNYIRHRYRQPDYINFNKYPPPLQCLNWEQTERRKAEHRAYQKTLDAQRQKYYKLKKQQEPVAEQSLKDLFSGKQKNKQILKPFQAFAYALILSIQKEFEDGAMRVEKELIELKRRHLKLELEFNAGMEQIEKSFEARSDAVGEGNADPSLEQEICEAKNALVNYYLPLFAEINEVKYNKLIHAYKDYLNDYLYWIRLAVFTEEQYQLAYYDIVNAMLGILKSVELTTLHGFCEHLPEVNAKNDSLEIKKPDCPMPATLEIPFVIGKVYFDCDSWGIDGGEVLKLTIDHKIGAETTIAFGAGFTFAQTPKLFGDNPGAFNPGVDLNAKGQLFITFDGNTIMDGGFLWEAEIDALGIGKPYELKQNFTWAVVKGFTYEGILTTQLDKVFGIPPETQVNKNIKIFNPQ